MPLVVNGWTLLYHPVFGDRYAALRDQARSLKRDLDDASWSRHPTTKLIAGVRNLMLEVIPRDPLAAEYHLRGDLKDFYRASGLGLPKRYRLFWVASRQARAVIYLYLNDGTTLRKEGARSDPYVQFQAMVRRGDFGLDFDKNLAMWKLAQERTSDNPGTSR